MRWGSLLIIGLSVLGCQSARQQKQVVLVDPPATQPSERLGGALVFTPPVAQNQRELQLWREDRQRGAFAGYQETITEFSFQRTDDRQFIRDGNDFFMRRSVNGRQRVTYR